MYLWRAVDDEGEVLDILVQAKRDKRSALKLMRKLMKKYCFIRYCNPIRPAPCLNNAASSSVKWNVRRKSSIR